MTLILFKITLLIKKFINLPLLTLTLQPLVFLDNIYTGPFGSQGDRDR